MSAYNDLSTCRSMDGPIPWLACQLYADRKGLAADVASLLWTVVREMDVAERKWHADNPPPKSEPAGDRDRDG